MGIELQRQLDIAVTKQSLHGFWIGSDTDEKRREAVAQIMKTESSWVVIDQPTLVIASWCKDACLDRRRAKMVFYQRCWQHAAAGLSSGRKGKTQSPGWEYGVLCFHCKTPAISAVGILFSRPTRCSGVEPRPSWS